APEPFVIGLRPFQHPTHDGARAALAQELAGLLAQLFQVVAEIEVHRLVPPLALPDVQFAGMPRQLSKSPNGRHVPFEGSKDRRLAPAGTNSRATEAKRACLDPAQRQPSLRRQRAMRRSPGPSPPRS